MTAGRDAVAVVAAIVATADAGFDFAVNAAHGVF